MMATENPSPELGRTEILLGEAKAHAKALERLLDDREHWLTCAREEARDNWRQFEQYQEAVSAVLDEFRLGIIDADEIAPRIAHVTRNDWRMAND